MTATESPSGNADTQPQPVGDGDGDDDDDNDNDNDNEVRAGFDLRGYTYDPQGLRPEDVDLGALTGLRQKDLRAIAHLAAVEHQTIRLLRDVLVTPSHAEARFTAFLTTWAYEQYWLAETLDAVLEVNGWAEEEDVPLRARMLRSWDDRVMPTVRAVRTNILGEKFVAGHMVTGLLDVLVTRLAHQRLAALEPRLVDLVDAVLRTKEQHVRFYTEQARGRLEGHPDAQRLARRMVRGWSWPGGRFGDRDRIAGVLRHLLAAPCCRQLVEEIDSEVAALPGLTGHRVLRRDLGRFARRAAPGR